MNSRALSETLGFIFAFALVTSSVGIVYTTGVGGLDSAKQYEQVNNAERAFDVLDDNLGDIHRHGAPSRSTEMRLVDARLRLGEPVTISISNTSSPDGGMSVTVSTRPIVYSNGDGTQLVYVAGAVIRAEEEGSVMKNEPGFINTPEQSVVPLVVTNPATNVGTVEGGTTVRIVGTRATKGIAEQFQTSPDDNVTVTVDSPRNDAWKRHFEDRGWHEVSNPNEDEITYRFTTERVSVPQTVIEIEFQT